MRKWGKRISSDENRATSIPVLGVPSQMNNDQWVTVGTTVSSWAKMHSMALI